MNILGSLKNDLLRTAQNAGGFKVLKWLTRKQPKVLMYHRFSMHDEPGKVSAAVFERQMQILKSQFNVMPMPEVCEQIRQGGTLPDNTIILTIDDGYKDFYDVAYPIIRKHDLPATIYLTTGFVDKSTWLWPDMISYILENTLSDKISIRIDSTHELNLKTESHFEKNTAWNKLINICTSIDNNKRLELLSLLPSASGVSVPATPAPEYEPLGWNQILDMTKNKIDVGAHTFSHPILSRVEPDQLAQEILKPKQRIEQLTGRIVTSFCYPNGQPADQNHLVKEQVINAGYTSATVAFYDKYAWQDLYAIRRFSASSNMYHFNKVVNGSQIMSSLFRPIKHQTFI